MIHVHKYLSMILHSCDSNVEYLTFPLIVEHRSLHSIDEPALLADIVLSTESS